MPCIAVLVGDGIGRIVTQEGLEATAAVDTPATSGLAFTAATSPRVGATPVADTYSL